jgi:PEP-CTERM/exosortase A-associated glycosyltransferase
MRILHVLDHSIPLHSGYTFRTLALLREQQRLGWQTYQITGPKQGRASTIEETVDGWHFYRTSLVPGPLDGLPGVAEWHLMRTLARRLHDVATQVRPHLIHVHSPVLNAFPALKVGRRLGVPVVYEVRAFWEDAAVDHGTAREDGLRYRLTRALETRALGRAAHVFTICEGLRSDIVARGIPARKVTVIPNAVDVHDFELRHEADPALRRRLGLDGCTVIGFIGSFYAYEGLDLLLDALPALLAQRPTVRLLLVGGGPQEAALRGHAVRLGVDDKVVFTGRVPHGEVQSYYDLVDLLAYPRHAMRLTDLVTPLKPLEAMAQGRLFVASDVGGHRELIRHGETGWLFHAGSAQALAGAIDEMLRRRADWPRLRANGRRFVESERHWARSAQGYVAPFLALAGAAA